MTIRPPIPTPARQPDATGSGAQIETRTSRAARTLQWLHRMELTGTRRIIHTTLFATVAWAGYFILFMWSWGAGNGASLVLGFAAIAFAAPAIRRPTVRSGRGASWLLVALTPAAVVELLLRFSIIETELPMRVYYDIPKDIVTTCVAVITLSGFILLYAMRRLATLEHTQRERVCELA